MTVLRCVPGLAAGLLLLCAGLLPGAPAAAQTRGAAPATAQELALPSLVAELEGISEYRLANGLQLLLFPDPSSTTTTVNIVYRVGSLNESYGETGMAHLLEHMLFKGTPTWGNITQEFARRAMRWNATTSYSRTNYFSSFNANDDTLAFALQLEADRMRNARVTQPDLDSEMTVVRNEFERGENSAYGVLNQRVMAAAFDWHAYGRSIIGARSDIEGVGIDRLQAFYSRYYRPDNATLMLAGRFDAARVLALVQRHFAGLPNSAQALARPYTTEPTQDGERAVTVRRVGQQPMVLALWHTPAMTHPDAPALSVLGQMLSANPGGAMFKRLVENKRVRSAFASASNQAEAGWFSAGVIGIGEDDVGPVTTELLDLLEGRSRPAFEAAEVERVRNEVASGYARALRSPENLVMQLTEVVPLGDWRMIFAQMQRIQAVTLEDVERVARTYLKPSNRTLGTYLPTAQPDRAAIPAAPAVADVVKALRLSSTVAAGESFDATPANLEARVLRRTLPSGILLATLRKQNRGDSVLLRMEVDWARPGELAQTRRGYGHVADLLFEGTTTRTRQQQIDALTALRAVVHVNGGSQGLSLSISAERSTLLAALELVADALKNPLLPQAAFERNKARQLSGIEAGRQNLGTLISHAWRTHLNSERELSQWWDPRYTSSDDELAERLRQVGIDDVRAVHRDLWAANGARVAVVGGIPDALEAAIEQHFGSWKKPLPSYQRFTATHTPISPRRFDVQAADKANAELSMVTFFALNRLEADYEPLLLAVRMFGGGGMDNRLAQRIRERDGLSYGVSAALSVNYFDNRSQLRISASFAPENRDRMLAAVGGEIERVRSAGFGPEELERARNDILQSWRRSRAQDGSIGSNLLWQLETGKTFAELSEEEDRLKAVTLAQVNAVFARYIAPERFVTAVAGDFAGKPQTMAGVSPARP